MQAGNTASISQVSLPDGISKSLILLAYVHAPARTLPSRLNAKLIAGDSGPSSVAFSFLLSRSHIFNAVPGPADAKILLSLPNATELTPRKLSLREKSSLAVWISHTRTFPSPDAS